MQAWEFMGNWYKTKSLFELTQEDLDWIEKRRPGAAIDDDYNIIFEWSELVSYHNNDYDYETLKVTMPEIIHKAFYEIEQNATKEVQKNLRRLLGII